MGNYISDRKSTSNVVKLLADNLVIERVLNGETDLFEILMRRHNELLYRTIRSYLYIEADVEDTMQNAYVKAFSKLYQFRNNALFSTWLVRIGINEALQLKRKAKRNETIDINEQRATLQIADTSIMNPEITTIYKESKVFIEKAIDSLPPKYKIVFMLQEVEGMEIAEIAECLQITTNNVKIRLYRARNMMKDFLLHEITTHDFFEFGNSRCDKIVENVMNRIQNINQIK